MVAMIKSGRSRLPLDRVAALAKAIEVDAPFLWRLAVEQHPDPTLARAVAEAFGSAVSTNEAEWLAAIRKASGDIDPPLTRRARRAILEIFGK